MSFISKLWNDESGQGMVEYGLIIALIAVAVIGVLGFMGDELNNIFETIKNKLSGAGAGTGGD